MYLCSSCFLVGFCELNKVYIVNDAEINEPNLVKAVRNFLSENTVKPSQLIDWVFDLYRDLNANIVDQNGEQIFLELDALEYSDDLMDTSLATQEKERLRDWCRTMTTPVAVNATPYVRAEAKERFRLLATIIIAANPDIGWPRILPENDNFFAANDNISSDR